VTSATARYDGHSQWYDEHFSGLAAGPEEQFLRHHLGSGAGAPCLDVACGTGRFGPAIAAAGYRPVGIDLSADQLRIGAPKLAAAIRADAGRLPLRDGAVGAAAGMFFHTDLDDLDGVLREVARCLRPGGRLVYVGIHPCFVGPFVYRLSERADRSLTFLPGYGTPGWATRGSGDGSGVWGRVGGHHKTLAEFLTAVADAGLILRAAREFHIEADVVPWNFGIVADKPATD
jgi:SAM-dependent methyltransferase